MKDLGGLGADVLGDPAGINNSTQVVGGSCDSSGNCRAFLWQNNVLSDLNFSSRRIRRCIWCMRWGSMSGGDRGLCRADKHWRHSRNIATPIPGEFGEQSVRRPHEAGPVKAGRLLCRIRSACCFSSACPSAASEPAKWVAS